MDAHMRIPVCIAAVIALSAVAHAQDQNLSHARTYGPRTSGFNRLVLGAIDIVQATAMDGGGYFTGVKADPPESPMGYPLKLGGKAILDPPRCSSYCSGASYSVFIEALNLWLRDHPTEISDAALENLRMQEPDGGRREDEVKVWGWWNANGFGSEFAVVQVMKAGQRIAAKDAQPGDFMNISWKSGHGHSVVFLQWERSAEGVAGIRYWSSQAVTNGMSDAWAPLDAIVDVCAARVTDPAQALKVESIGPVDRSVVGDKLWEKDLFPATERKN